MQGSNGEYVYLREDERVELVRQAAQMAAPDKIIIAGAGCECKYNGVYICCRFFSLLKLNEIVRLNCQKHVIRCLGDLAQ